jgi:hypothetical protein
MTADGTVARVKLNELFSSSSLALLFRMIVQKSL